MLINLMFAHDCTQAIHLWQENHRSVCVHCILNGSLWLRFVPLRVGLILIAWWIWSLLGCPPCNCLFHILLFTGILWGAALNIPFFNKSVSSSFICISRDLGFPGFSNRLWSISNSFYLDAQLSQIVQRSALVPWPRRGLLGVWPAFRQGENLCHWLSYRFSFERECLPSWCTKVERT